MIKPTTTRRGPTLRSRALPFALLCALTSLAEADVRYQIHPTDGEFVKTSEPCGTKTKDDLFTRVIRFVPWLVVDDHQAMTLIVDGHESPADKMLNGVGWWHYDSKQHTYAKTMVISLKPGKKDSQKIISIGVIRRMDDLECGERWVGLVKEAREK